MQLATTTERVQMHTDEEVNRKIMAGLKHRLWYYLDHPEEIDARLLALQREWDIERAIEANAATLALTGLVLGFVASRKYLLLPTVVTGFLLQHALQGWCPPVPVFRRFGIRTQGEIQLERYALKALRGDFASFEKPVPARERERSLPVKLLQAAQR